MERSLLAVFDRLDSRFRRADGVREMAFACFLEAAFSRGIFLRGFLSCPHAGKGWKDAVFADRDGMNRKTERKT